MLLQSFFRQNRMGTEMYWAWSLALRSKILEQISHGWLTGVICLFSDKWQHLAFLTRPGKKYFLCFWGWGSSAAEKCQRSTISRTFETFSVSDFLCYVSPFINHSLAGKLNQGGQSLITDSERKTNLHVR